MKSGMRSSRDRGLDAPAPAAANKDSDAAQQSTRAGQYRETELCFLALEVTGGSSLVNTTGMMLMLPNLESVVRFNAGFQPISMRRFLSQPAKGHAESAKS